MPANICGNCQHTNREHRLAFDMRTNYCTGDNYKCQCTNYVEERDPADTRPY